MRVLYLFSGEDRKSSVVSKLKELSPFPQIMIFHKQVARSTAWGGERALASVLVRRRQCPYNHSMHGQGVSRSTSCVQDVDRIEICSVRKRSSIF